MKLRLQGGTQRRDVEISFVEPYFLDHRLMLGVDLYQHDSYYYSTEYSQKDTGGRLTLGQPLGGYNRLNYIYSLDAFNIYDVSTNSSPLIQQEAGARLKSAFTLELVHDARDRPFVPTRGNRSSISAQIAGGPLGGDTDIYGLQGRSSQYYPLWFDHVLNIRGQMAFVDSYGSSDRVPLFDRLFLGGPYSLRAFKYREVGPSDGAPNYEPIGGQSMAFACAEYTIPIIEKIRVATFYDIGMVWNDPFYFTLHDFNSDVGLGIRFDFPGFPIQLDYAWPIHAEDFNNHPSGRFSFSIGYQY
ncbi:MAG: BamA/TamA family outer membrane protein [Kiritimatiellaeota bacterium]|nr:BamA/TamA family outer membrane protein [Kiritimatiellota bacterium]